MEKTQKKGLGERELTPIHFALAVAVLLILVVYSAYVSGFLPFLKPESEFGKRVAEYAGKSGGDFNKLSESEKQYLNKMTSGRGAIALSEYKALHRKR
jgi:hypothetical protein